MMNLQMLVTTQNGVQFSLPQDQNMFIGGNNWRRITFAVKDAVDIKWIGIECESQGQSLLLGQFSC